MNKQRKFLGTFAARCADGTRVNIFHYVEILCSASSAGTVEVEGDHLLFDERKQDVQRLKKGSYELQSLEGDKIIAVSDDPDAP